MIGIVVVSHSAAVARATVDLAADMVEADDLPTIEIAAGLDESTFGTDAAAIAEALAAVDSGDGVLVLLDLGSAIMSTEMALESIDPDVAERVAISSAPLVEGLVAAVVTAASGAALEEVRVEAERGLIAKQDHLCSRGSAAANGAEDADAEDAQASELSAEMVVDTPHGLHARPAARFVSCVKRFSQAEVRLRNIDGSERFVDAGSLSGVATLGIGNGDRIDVRASGSQAADVLDALAALAAEGFGDTPTAATAQPQTAPAPPDSGPHSGTSGSANDDGATSTTDLGASPTAAPAAASMGSGLEAAIGVLTRPASGADIEDYRASGDPKTEHARLSDAISVAQEQLAALVDFTRSTIGDEQAQVFEAHQAMLDDAAIVQPAHLAIDEGDSAVAAWRASGHSVVSQFEALSDAYQRERAQDVRSVSDRVLRILVDRSAGGEEDGENGKGTKVGVRAEPKGEEQDQGRSEEGCEKGQTAGHGVDGGQAAGHGVILVVPELDPGTAATIDVEHVAGILCAAGGSTGHGVIIASARGIPVLTGVVHLADVAEGSTVAFDARSGQVLIEPTEAQRAEFEQMLTERGDQQDQDRAHATDPGRTSEGHPVAVMANVTSVEDARRAVELGAQGSGLVRTEVMFESWKSMPTVAEQVAEFTAVARALDGTPMTIRTWDIGADKPLAFWTQEHEQNPFLGVRGVRSFVSDPTPLRDQLSAACQVAAEYPVAVMFPMVSTVDEVTWLLEQLDAVCEDRADGRPPGLRVGIMIEVPAAALRAAAMTASLDFVSIGTNDLTQYVLAAERGNPGVDELFDTLDPAVLTLIDKVCREVGDGVDVGVCGAAASDPASAALLVGLGVHDLSATPVAVPRVKSVLRQHSREQLRALGSAALRCERAEQVRHLLRTELGSN